MKQPQRLTLSNMFDMLDNEQKQSNRLYFKNGLAVVLNINKLFKPFINSAQSPYLLEDYRLGVVKRGYMHGYLNLQEYVVKAGSAVFICPGSIVEPLEMSDDFLVTGMGIPADLFQFIHQGQSLEVFNGLRKHGVRAICEGEIALLDRMFQMLWQLVTITDRQYSEEMEGVSRDVVNHMLAAITCRYNDIFMSQRPEVTIHRTANDIFDRFIRLVNDHCRTQRQLAFYADKICVTERYLGTVVRQVSGITAKEWIDKAVITIAKVMLRHGNLSVAEIADRLHFATASFFCKYFKRLEGCTPQEYRLSK